MGRPECEVIDIAGDGSFLMNSQELATAVVNDIPVKVAILNNGCLGMVQAVAGAVLREEVLGHHPWADQPRFRQAG